MSEHLNNRSRAEQLDLPDQILAAWELGMGVRDISRRLHISETIVELVVGFGKFPEPEPQWTPEPDERDSRPPP